MIDVRLTATNPEDSTLVPVPCNARGELLTVAPVIEAIPNDVEIQGDLTVTGLINGSIGVGEPGPEGPAGPDGPPGIGVPQPIGTDGQYLRVVNGEPAWTDGPRDPDAAYVELLNPELLTVQDAAGQIITPDDPIAHCMSLPTWMSRDEQSLEGFHAPVVDQIEGCPNLEFQWVNGAGKILRILYGINWMANETFGTIYSLKGYRDERLGCTLIDRDDPPESWWGDKDKYYWHYRDVTYALDNDVGTASVQQFFCPYAKYRDLSYMFRGVEIIDAGTYALQNQLKMKNEIEGLKAKVAAIAANS